MRIFQQIDQHLFELTGIERAVPSGRRSSTRNSACAPSADELGRHRFGGGAATCAALALRECMQVLRFRRDAGEYFRQALDLPAPRQLRA